jgi:hypothetical protein
MLCEAAASLKEKMITTKGWGYVGIILEDPKAIVRLDFDKPGELRFLTRCKINFEKAVKLGVGKVWEENWVPGKSRWGTILHLDSEAVHFFDHTKAGQMKLLEDWLKECISKTRSIETPDQPPIPENPEET